MQWRVELKAKAAQAINKLDAPQRERIRAFLKKQSTQTNPRATGKALQGQLAGYWRYRVGDYRIICQIKDGELLILVIEIGHRKDIYR
ncbi:MAG: type II toxin-antitoxin system RelE/ParE family toxin [Methylovulum miyakonense]|uniref:type II toxin-antitoxin system RelE family toxin n=1 Tax=Methylovulum miyakonense TaxID=645578 RepID=UPI0003609A58|nr:type II toxin-antitoxin system RelE/ParE family toxin [Methylovulum miyakonense]